MNIPFRVREQVLVGREFRYIQRPNFNVLIKDIDVPLDGIKGCRVALSTLLPEEFEVVSVNLQSRTEGVATIRVKATRALQAAPGSVKKPVARASAKLRPR